MWAVSPRVRARTARKCWWSIRGISAGMRSTRRHQEPPTSTPFSLPPEAPPSLCMRVRATVWAADPVLA